MSGTSFGVHTFFHERLVWFVEGGGGGKFPLITCIDAIPERSGVQVTSGSFCRYQTLLFLLPDCSFM